MKHVSLILRSLGSCLVALVLLAAPIQAAEVQVYAAASLTDALKEIASVYEKSSEDRLVFNFAASSLLARQIQEGAPADLFISADEEKMDSLEKKGLILKETRKSLLSNTLVMVVPNDRRLFFKSPGELAGPQIKRIALAEPQSVPAGIYAKRYLQKINLWDAVVDRVIPVENVRAALAAVEYGNVDAGIVYQTDAVMSKRVTVAYEVTPAEGPAISYPFAIIKDSKNPEGAEKFLRYLSSPEGLQVVKAYGFIVQKESW